MCSSLRKQLIATLPSPLVLTPAAWMVWESASGSEQFQVGFLCFLVGAFTCLTWVCVEIIRHFQAIENMRLFRIAVAVSVLTVTSIPVFEWPVRAAFTIWREPIEALYAKAERGVFETEPIRIGPFLFLRTENRYSSYVALILDSEPSGPTSLVKGTRPPGNAWSAISLSGDWWLHSED